MGVISFTIPIRAPSTSNLREHWAVKAKRVETQRRATRAKCPVWTAGPLLVVTLTRVSPRPLDDDNLRGALKAYRDGVASWLKVDDASPLVKWEYAQAEGEASVRVEIQLAPAKYNNALNPPSIFEW